MDEGGRRGGKRRDRGRNNAPRDRRDDRDHHHNQRNKGKAKGKGGRKQQKNRGPTHEPSNPDPTNGPTERVRRRSTSKLSVSSRDSETSLNESIAQIERDLFRRERPSVSSAASSSTVALRERSRAIRKGKVELKSVNRLADDVVNGTVTLKSASREMQNKVLAIISKSNERSSKYDPQTKVYCVLMLLSSL